MAPLHPAGLQPSQRRGGAAHPPGQLRDHQHAPHADTDVSRVFGLCEGGKHGTCVRTHEMHTCSLAGTQMYGL